MDIKVAVRQYVSLGRDLLDRLRSSEGNSLNSVDLHLLQDQLHLLENETTNMLYVKDLQPKDKLPETISSR
jgi:hypothetical protein